MSTVNVFATTDVSESSNFLLRVGEGTKLENDDQMIHLDEKFVVSCENISDLVNSVYENIHKNYTDCNFIRQIIILCPELNMRSD